MLPQYFSAAGVPTNADECLEADQSNLTGPVLFLREVSGRCSTVSFEACSNELCVPRGQYNSLSKHAFAEAGFNLTL